MTSNPIDWTQDVATDPALEYRALLKSLRRTRDFGLFFVQCSPAEGQRLIAQIKADLPQKHIEVLKLEQAIENLYDIVAVLPNKDQIEILFIQGLELSFYEYEKEKLWNSSEERYGYSEGNVPKLLAHLNISRERFRDQFNICFVFLVPLYVLKYLMRRAPDFFDWRSGVLEFLGDPDRLQQEIQRIRQEGQSHQYLSWTPQKRDARILEIQAFLEEPFLPVHDKIVLLYEQSALFYDSEKYTVAVACCDQAIQLKPDNSEAWYGRAIALLALGLNEMAISSFDNTLEIEPNNYRAWGYRGIALAGLGRNEEAVSSYDQAIAIQPDYYRAWFNRGYTLSNLGRQEEAINSFDKALEIKPDDYEAWYRRGDSLAELGCKEAAIVSYDKALEIKPDYYQAWNSRGYTFFELGQYVKAISSFKEALHIKQNDDKVLSNLAAALGGLGQSEEAIIYCDKALASNQNNENAWFDRGNSLIKLNRYEEAITSYDKALAIKFDDYAAWNNRGNALSALGRKEEAIASYERALAIRRQINDQRGIANTLFAMVSVYRQMGRWQEAMAASSEALKILQSLNVPIDEMPYPKWVKALLKFANQIEVLFKRK